MGKVSTAFDRCIKIGTLVVASFTLVATILNGCQNQYLARMTERTIKLQPLRDFCVSFAPGLTADSFMEMQLGRPRAPGEDLDKVLGAAQTTCDGKLNRWNWSLGSIFAKEPALKVAFTQFADNATPIEANFIPPSRDLLNDDFKRKLAISTNKLISAIDDATGGE